MKESAVRASLVLIQDLLDATRTALFLFETISPKAIATAIECLLSANASVTTLGISLRLDPIENLSPIQAIDSARKSISRLCQELKDIQTEYPKVSIPPAMLEKQISEINRVHKDVKALVQILSENDTQVSKTDTEILYTNALLDLPVEQKAILIAPVNTKQSAYNGYDA